MATGIAFLRAINVGGRVVKMDRLRALFESEGFSNVETFIASGNVFFDLAAGKKTQALERTIEATLKNALGYEVATFVRTTSELKAVVEHQPFSPAALKRSKRFNVAFLRHAPDAKAIKAIMALKSPLEDLDVRGREIYWLSRVGQADSKISNAAFEKTLGQSCTVRGISTIRKMAEKL